MKFYPGFPDASGNVCPSVREVLAPFPVLGLFFRDALLSFTDAFPEILHRYTDILHCYTVVCGWVFYRFLICYSIVRRMLRTLSVRIPDDVYSALLRIAQSRGVPLSEVIREALSQYVSCVASEGASERQDIVPSRDPSRRISAVPPLDPNSWYSILRRAGLVD